MLGCIPIIRKSELDSLYEDLPVLLVDDYSQINENLLLDTIKEFKNKKFRYEKLELEYWIKQINEYRQNRIKKEICENIKKIMEIDETIKTIYSNFIFENGISNTIRENVDISIVNNYLDMIDGSKYIILYNVNEYNNYTYYNNIKDKYIILKMDSDNNYCILYTNK
jgi:hypothetical protein